MFHSLLQMLIPFDVYIITEDIFHASGILAVVAAGMVHSFVRKHTETLLAEGQKESLRLKVLDAERFEIHKVYEAGDISITQDKELRRFTNQIESVILYEYSE